MSTHNICFDGEIRQKKNSEHSSYLELYKYFFQLCMFTLTPTDIVTHTF